MVETIGFNGKAWLDQRGNPTTEALRVTERSTAATSAHGPSDPQSTIQRRTRGHGPSRFR